MSGFRRRLRAARVSIIPESQFMTGTELRAAFSLAAVFSTRLLGLFMIYPIFAVYARHLRGATPTMIGLALGAYGLTQGLLQIPFGLLSDRIGRKVVIAFGLLLFAIGSAVAAMSDTITGVLIGRALQGMGAVGSVILALVADLTREEIRTRAMAIVGMTIGASFGAAMLLGPVLMGWIGGSGIFWLTVGLALLGIAISQFVVPTPEHPMRHRDAETVPALMARVVRDRSLLRLDFSIFCLHALLTASFLAVPHVLARTLSLGVENDWKVYLPTLLVSVALMVPAIIIAETRRRMKEVFVATIVLLGVSQLALAFAGASPWVAVGALVAFFAGFNIMEASLPSLVTKMAPAGAKGTATGIYSSSQFFGIFVGGAFGGWVYGVGGTSGVFAFTVVLSIAWLLVALGLPQPGRYSSYLARLGDLSELSRDAAVAELSAMPGVMEAVVVPEEGVAYLKIDRDRFDEEAVKRTTGAVEVPRTAEQPG